MLTCHWRSSRFSIQHWTMRLQGLCQTIAILLVLIGPASLASSATILLQKEMIGLFTWCCRVLEAVDDIIVSVKSGSAASSGERERAIMGALPAAASLAVQSLLSSAPQKQLSSPLTTSTSPR